MLRHSVSNALLNFWNIACWVKEVNIALQDQGSKKIKTFYPPPRSRSQSTAASRFQSHTLCVVLRWPYFLLSFNKQAKYLLFLYIWNLGRVFLSKEIQRNCKMHFSKCAVYLLKIYNMQFISLYLVYIYIWLCIFFF